MVICMKISVDIIVPCFNEAENLPKLFSSFSNFKESHSKEYEISLILVDNGSTDNSIEIAKNFIDHESACRLISLSRNFGKESSLTAGLLESTAELVVPIDADLQDPIEVISDMLTCWKSTKVDVVLARRESRNVDSVSRRIYSFLYMKIFSSLADIDLPLGVGEFRLMTRKVVDAFGMLPESQRFVRGLFAWLGFKTETIYFTRNARDHGKSRFSLRKLLNLAIDGIVSFSTKPLRLSIGLGFVSAFVAFIFSVVVIFEKVFHKVAVPGYTSLAFLILFLGGIQLFSIGVLGEYVGKILMETKRRPIYLVNEKYGRNGNK